MASLAFTSIVNGLLSIRVASAVCRGGVWVARCITAAFTGARGGEFT